MNGMNINKKKCYAKPLQKNHAKFCVQFSPSFELRAFLLIISCFIQICTDMGYDIDWVAHCCLSCDKDVIEGAFCSIQCILMDSKQPSVARASRFSLLEDWRILDESSHRNSSTLCLDLWAQRSRTTSDPHRKEDSPRGLASSTEISYAAVSRAHQQPTRLEASYSMWSRRKIDKSMHSRGSLPQRSGNQTTISGSSMSYTPFAPKNRIELEDLHSGITFEPSLRIETSKEDLLSDEDFNMCK